MGYSLSVRFKNQQERDTMLAFLQRQDWSTLHATSPHAFETHPEQGTDLGYPPPGKPENMIGFNASIIPYYAWSVAAWMATQSSFRSKGQIVMYHDAERMVIEQCPATATLHTAVDERGIVIPKNKKTGLLVSLGSLLSSSAGREDFAAQHAWLVNMDQAWQQEQALSASVSPANTVVSKKSSPRPR